MPTLDVKASKSDILCLIKDYCNSIVIPATAFTDADVASKPLCVDKQFQKNKAIRSEPGFDGCSWITSKHFWPKSAY